MKIICTSDIHGKSEKINKLADVQADLIIVAGDLTNFGHKNKAMEILKSLQQIGKVLAVHGNCDYADVEETLSEIGVNLHSKGVEIGGIGFFGVGGSSLTPFNTPQEYSEEEIKKALLKGYEMVADLEVKVLVSHSPPVNTTVDKTSSGFNAGSEAVRKFIEEYQPNLVICGHIHEAKGKDMIGRTLVVNPGPLHHGFALAHIDDGSIDIEFHKL